MSKYWYLKIWLFLLVVCFICCSTEEPTVDDNPVTPNTEEPNEDPNEDPVERANIDLNNWKVTLPIGNPTEIEPPEILEYYNLDQLKPYMYDDYDEQEQELAIVFYTEPGSSTANSSYSRTELREQMVPGSNSTNWTFAEGGKMKGTLRLSDISTDNSGDYHRTIIMQIHGRLTNEQRDLIGEDDNNAPPVLKIYWEDGKISVRRKVLKDIDVNEIDILKKESWKDEAHDFDKQVDFEQFTLEIEAKDGYLRISLNEGEDGEEEVVYEDIHMERWGVFENYFKAGNYLQTTGSGTFSEVKYYALEVSHQ